MCGPQTRQYGYLALIRLALTPVVSQLVRAYRKGLIDGLLQQKILPGVRPLRGYRLLLWPAKLLCGLVTGHNEHGDTGYGGGDWADTWCKHCDQRMRIPVEETQYASLKGKIGVPFRVEFGE